MRFDRYDRIVNFYPTQWPLIIPGYVPILNAMVDIVHARNVRPRELLDVGCGPASATVAVAPACDPEGHVTLVDGSDGMLQSAQSVLSSYVRSAVHGDFTTPEIVQRAFTPATFDLVLASFALHHINDQLKRQAIENMANAMMPGGLLLLADEVVADRPLGWDVVERIRSRVMTNNLAGGRMHPTFQALETSLPQRLHLPFLPARIDDFTSWMARAGLAVACPITIFGSALLIGIKPG